MTQDHHGGNGGGHAPAAAHDVPSVYHEGLAGTDLNPESLEDKVDHSKFKAFMDYIHPQNLGKVEDIADRFANRAYDNFIANAEKGGLKLYMDPSSDGKTANGKKVLDSFLLYLLREFKPKIADSFSGELDDEQSGHLRNLIGLYIGLDSQLIGQVEEALKAGGNLRGALKELRGRVTQAYVQKSISRKFMRYVPEEHTQEFVEYFKKENGIEDIGQTPRALLPNEAYQLVTAFTQHKYQPQPSSLDNILSNFKMKYTPAPAGGNAPAEPAAAGNH